MNAASILVVDDEPQIRRVMRTTLFHATGTSSAKLRLAKRLSRRWRKERPGPDLARREYARHWGHRSRRARFVK